MAVRPRTSPARSLPPARVRSLREALGGWYARERRDLPWRRTRDPYAIWVSEAMLQQTRVETVIPYWERFLERFPTISALAAASEEDLLAAWSGLGYYRRARSLRQAALAVEERFGGRFPRDAEDALSLPGVGPYTAGAVLSIAFDEPRAVVDGNVLRVFARLFALEEPLGSSALAKRVWGLAEELVPPRGGRPGPGDWNQALMELGATLCTPREPRCADCPIRTGCTAHARGVVARLPRPGPKAQPIDVELEVLVVASTGGLLLQRRPPGGRMAGLWELPTREVPPPGAEPEEARTRLWPATFAEPAPGAALRPGARLAEVRHGITRHRIRAVVRRGRLAGAAALSDGFARVAVDRASGLALTGMTRKVLGAAGLGGDRSGAGRA